MNSKKQVGLVGDLTIKASEYGVNSWENFKAVLGDEVTIEIVVEANDGNWSEPLSVCSNRPP